MPKAPPVPPTRTIPPIKAMKTERTHEENQERAYIAASRRSDRSLEARVESARRASEIHKRRTGRSLRVTEQDVINEEMYEEEDDDLPLRYRRLTAHLQTGSADFNRRLSAYLTQQVAVRNMMGQMSQSPYAQYPNMPYQPQTANMFAPPLMPQANLGQSPTTSYRSVPYPSPHQTDYRQSHGRSYSMASLPNNKAPASPNLTIQTPLDQRRLSTPTNIHTNGETQQAGHGIDTNNIKPDPDYLHQAQSATFPPSGSFPPLWQDIGPFTTSLPPEAQQMLAYAPQFDVNDPNYTMLMHGSDQFISSPYYPWHDMNQSGLKGMPVHPSAYPGMSATLAPSALEQHPMSQEEPSQSNKSSTSLVAHHKSSLTQSSLPPTAGLDFNFSRESKGFDFGSMDMSREDSLQGMFKTSGMPSGQVTPAGEGFWDNFVMDGSWEDEQQASKSMSGSIEDEGSTTSSVGATAGS
ncbi:uncharacterized protein A1O9_00584 [Exophiala aquamarina CBS 119918]|uniref:Uncharacterized protein n=1 Tax=Exophiala aquamarina CBS 119918 TaxID=1182545 RepID=A0A072PRW0_9EURO|nr:uncharacterized protein A1O9_00584 [Exophiala aquamarina CBS 119918]KEF62611.1 hypothetical protein A1O9_00584 [Exophiala aquamarina CBS 119918]